MGNGMDLDSGLKVLAAIGILVGIGTAALIALAYSGLLG